MYLLKDCKIRGVCDEKTGKWYFCAVDVCAILTGREESTAREYWRKLKYHLTSMKPFSALVKMKMRTPGGQLRYTDALSLQQVIYLIQVIPDKNAEPFRLWLAEAVAAENGEVAREFVKLVEAGEANTREEITRSDSEPIRVKTVTRKDIVL